MTPLTYLVSGKILETIGACLVAYVGFRAAVLEVMIGRHFRGQSLDAGDVDKLKKGLEAILEKRNRQFGLYEAMLVGSGTALVAIGCALYLAGVLTETH
jgi:hypothetical protein